MCCVLCMCVCVCVCDQQRDIELNRDILFNKIYDNMVMVSGDGFWLLVISLSDGFWLPVMTSGFWFLASGFWLLAFGGW